MIYNYRIKTEEMVFPHPTLEKHEIFINPFIPLWKDGWYKECLGCKNWHSNGKEKNCNNCVRCPYSNCGSREDFYTRT